MERGSRQALPVSGGAGRQSRQSDDDQLEKMAVRIRARAVRRCGELLKQFDAKGKRTDREEPTVGGFGKLSQKEAVERAGMSEPCLSG